MRTSIRLAPLLLLLAACRGGPSRGAVADGQPCAAASECASGACSGGACRPAAGESIAVVKSCEPPAEPDAAKIHEADDVVYTTAKGTEVKLDVAWPRDDKRHPLVILIHGGGWFGGDKSLHTKDMRALAGLGYAAATINYRNGRAGATYPAHIADARCAVRYLRANAEKYGVDPARVAAMGVSAGAHLGAELADASELGEHDDGTCQWPGSAAVQAFAGHYGIYDLRSTAGVGGPAERFVSGFLGGAPESDPARARAASPIAHLDWKDPPQLITYGTADPLVPASQSKGMHAAARAAGVASTILEVPGEGHDYPLLAGGATLPVTCTTLAFLAAKIGPP